MNYSMMTNKRKEALRAKINKGLDLLGESQLRQVLSVVYALCLSKGRRIEL